MTAHAEISDIVEEDHARGARRVVGLAEERPDQRIVAARLVDGEAADMIELASEAAKPRGEGPSPRGGPPSTTRRVGSPSVWESMTRTALILVPGEEAHQARNVPNRRLAMLSCDRLSASKSFKCCAYSS